MFLLMRQKTHRGKIKNTCTKKRVFAFFVCAPNLAQNRQPLSFAENLKEHRVCDTLYIGMAQKTMCLHYFLKISNHPQTILPGMVQPIASL